MNQNTLSYIILKHNIDYPEGIVLTWGSGTVYCLPKWFSQLCYYMTSQ